MENASKALIMAGGILISILVVSFMVLIFRKGGQMSAEYDTQRSDQELASFNNQFEVYAKDGNNIFDVITVCNMAWDENQKNGNDAQNLITVGVKFGNNNNNTYTINDKCEKNYFLDKKGQQVYFYDAKYNGDILVNAYQNNKDNGDKVQYRYLFKGVITAYNDTTGKVQSITFTSNGTEY